MALVVIVLLCSAAYMLHKKSRAGSRSTSRHPTEEEIPTLRVVALGTAGAGKTVLLASMFHELTFRTSGRPYVLDANIEQRNTLAGIHTQVLDSTRSWPAGTRVGQETEYLFPCVGIENGTRHPLFNISYLDYAGELFAPNKNPDEVRKLEAHVDDAHALFGMLDGRRLAQYLRNEPEGQTYMRGEILSMIGLLSRSTAPIHFIVTKWDLVRNIGEQDASDESRLALVRDALFEHPPVASLILDSVDKHRTVRLIPVSAVGNDFARVDDRGEVVKIAGAEMDAINLELPFAAVLPDSLAQLQQRLESADREVISTFDSLRTGTHDVWSSISGTAQGFIHAFVPQPTAFAVSAATDLVARWIGKSPQERLRAQTSNTATTSDASSRGSVQDAVLDSFVKSIWMLEAHAPSSVLTGGFST